MKCDIVVIIWNQLQMTKDCLESLISKTKIPYQLLLIDNGSDKETTNYLKDFALRYKNIVRFIRNETNLGFIRAANQGLKSSNADFVCLLNNDTLVTDDWLSELVYTASNNPKIGLLNPSSNTLGQKTHVNNIDNYARSLKRYHGQFEEMAQVSGFCMLIKKDMIERIGVFDEVYGMGFFEDTDYSRQVQEIGFISARALSSYVYHHENVSFQKLKKSDATFKKNQDIFYSRWGRPKRIFLEARYGLQPGQIDKTLNFARKGNWIIIAKEEGYDIMIAKHSNIKIFSHQDVFFLLMCFLKILKRVKKGYDLLIIQSHSLRKILEFFKPFHKAKILPLDKISDLSL